MNICFMMCALRHCVWICGSPVAGRESSVLQGSLHFCRSCKLGTNCPLFPAIPALLPRCSTRCVLALAERESLPEVKGGFLTAPEETVLPPERTQTRSVAGNVLRSRGEPCLLPTVDTPVALRRVPTCDAAPCRATGYLASGNQPQRLLLWLPLLLWLAVFHL